MIYDDLLTAFADEISEPLLRRIERQTETIARLRAENDYYRAAYRWGVILMEDGE